MSSLQPRTALPSRQASAESMLSCEQGTASKLQRHLQLGHTVSCLAMLMPAVQTVQD